MGALMLSGSPNGDGLTAACVDAAVRGLEAAGVPCEEIRLTDSNIGICRQCDNGWGTCLSEHRCRTEDGFEAVHERVLASEALVFVTPVYWGDLSESMKAFVDRLRRCEALRKPASSLSGVPVLGVAAAGGGGGGTVSCIEQIERFVSHIGLKRFDLIGVTRWSREHSLAAIELAARSLGNSLRGARKGGAI